MRTKRPTYSIDKPMAIEVQRRDLRRPSESAAKMRNRPHITIFTMPYTPVANRPV